LVVPVVEDEAEIVVAGPDQGDHLHQPGRQGVAQALQAERVREDPPLGLAAVAVDEEQHLLPGGPAQAAEERHRRQLEVALRSLALAEVERGARLVVARREADRPSGLAAARPLDSAVGDEEHDGGPGDAADAGL
jgi:hypothetical protein